MASNLHLLHSMKSADIHHYDKKLKNELRLLREQPFSASDRNSIAGYAHFLEAQGLNKGRIAKAIYQLRTLRKHMSCEFEKADKSSIETIVIWINNANYSSPELSIGPSGSVS